MEIKEEELRELVDDLWKWFSLFGQCTGALMGAIRNHGHEVDLIRMQKMGLISKSITKKLYVLRQRYEGETKGADSSPDAQV